MTPTMPVHAMIAALARGAIAGGLALGCMGQTEGEPGASGSSLQAPASSTLQTTVRRMGDVVEVEVKSDRPFRDSAMPPVLVIGDKAFGRSRNPPDRRLDTLI